MKPNLMICQSQCRHHFKSIYFDPKLKKRYASNCMKAFDYIGTNLTAKYFGMEQKVMCIHETDGTITIREEFEVPEQNCPYVLEHTVSNESQNKS